MPARKPAKSSDIGQPIAHDGQPVDPAKPIPPIPLFRIVSATYAPWPSSRVPSELIPFIGSPMTWVSVPDMPDGRQAGPSHDGRAFQMWGGCDGAALQPDSWWDEREEMYGGLGLPDWLVGDGDVVGVRVIPRNAGE